MIVRRSTADRQLQEAVRVAREDALVQSRTEVFRQLAAVQGWRPAIRLCEALGWVQEYEIDPATDSVRVNWRRSAPAEGGAREA